MTVSFTAKKCTSCGGRLEYIKNRKIWQCIYCGNEIVYEEKHDTLYTVKNVARQVIIDSAYRRFSEAATNINECEKIDSKYIGTIIARICYRMSLLITHDACKESDVPNIYQRLKDDLNILHDRNDKIEQDEIAFYEFIDETDAVGDCYAILGLVFDGLDDIGRAKFFFNHLDIKKVYCKNTNLDLLKYFIRTEAFERAGEIAFNDNSIDTRRTLDIILDQCPDNAIKKKCIEHLLAISAYTLNDKEKIEAYMQSEDSLETKIFMLKSIRNPNLSPGFAVFKSSQLKNVPNDKFSDLLSCITAGKLEDEEVVSVLEYAVNGSAGQCMIAIDKLIQGKKFVVVTPAIVQDLLSNQQLSAEDIISALEKFRSFTIEKKAFENATAEYLLNGPHDFEERELIINYLLDNITSVPIKKFEKYIVTSNMDGANKAIIVSNFFDLDNLKPTFFSDLFDVYFEQTQDDIHLILDMVDTLILCGVKVSHNSIHKLVENNKYSDENKLTIMKTMEFHGIHMPEDLLGNYIEKSFKDLNDAMFNFLFDRTTRVTDRALIAYLFRCHLREEIKANNAIELGHRNGFFGSLSCAYTFGSDKIKTNLLQGYLLRAPDGYDVGSEIVREMASTANIKADVEVNGKSMSFKSYVKANKEQLNEDALRLCQDYKLFALFGF